MKTTSLALSVMIDNVQAELKKHPYELARSFPSQALFNNEAHPIEDFRYVQDNLQEVLNNLLDTRKRLVELGCYSEKESKKQEVRQQTGSEIRSGMEKETQTPDRDSTQVSPHPSMEI